MDRRRSTNDISANVRFIEPGCIHISDAPMTLSAVLGSAVAVCCWDPARQRGGLAHYTWPRIERARDATARYGNVAIRHLIRLLRREGSPVDRLHAHLLGGACHPTRDDGGLARANIDIALRILGRSGVRLCSRDIGGALGRKITFDVGTGHVAILKVERIRQADWHALPLR